jgi:hypothetical protein
MTLEPRSITAGQSVRVTVTGRAGAVVRLHSYSRPGTTYAAIRTAVLDGAGEHVFTVRPTTNSRLFAQTPDGASESAVVLVRSVVSLAVASGPGCRLTATGSVYPRRAGVPVNIQYRLWDGRFVRAMSTVTRAGGVYAVGRAFEVCEATLAMRAVTPNTVVNLAGASRLRSGTISR